MAFQIRLPCVFHGGLEGDDQHTFTKTPVNNTKGPVNAVQKAYYFLIILLLNGITIMAFQTSSPEETPPAHDGPSKKPVFSCFNRQRCCYHRASCHARPNTTAIYLSTDVSPKPHRKNYLYKSANYKDSRPCASPAHLTYLRILMV